MIACDLNSSLRYQGGVKGVPRVVKKFSKTQKLIVLKKSLKIMTSYDLGMITCDLKSMLRYLGGARGYLGVVKNFPKIKNCLF